ncbi:MAG: peptidase M1, partial [Flavobacteriaceae bacterium CG02_land_8_20_14_3_00_34_13]
MKNLFGSTFSFLFCVLIASQSFAQLKNNQDKFDDFTYRHGTAYRSASGNPGPQYWQNGADYVMEADLDDKENAIKGKVEITYHNNSPEP